MKLFDTFLNILIALLGGACLLLIGVGWSRSSSSISGSEFDQGWLVAALFVSQAGTVRLSGGKLRRQEWLLIIPACLTSFALEALSDHFFLRLQAQPTRNRAIEFALLASLFLTNIVTWIVIFPYQEFLRAGSDRDGGPRVGMVRAAGASIAAVCAIGAVWCFLENATSNPGAIPDLHAWFYRAALLVYAFMVLRILWPLCEMRFREPDRAP
jgi:hypothetical protein